MRIKVWKSKDGWRVSLVWRNGRIFATSEAYSDAHEAIRAAIEARRVLTNGGPVRLMIAGKSLREVDRLLVTYGVGPRRGRRSA